MFEKQTEEKWARNIHLAHFAYTALALQVSVKKREQEAEYTYQLTESANTLKNSTIKL